MTQKFKIPIKLYSFSLGGYHKNFKDTLEIYNTSSDVFTRLSSKMPYSAIGVCPVMRNSDQKVYLTGGKTSSTYKGQMVAYDIGSLTLQTMAGTNITLEYMYCTNIHFNN